MRSRSWREGETGAGAGNEAGRKGQPGPGGLSPRLAAAGPALSSEAARGGLRSGPGRRRPPCGECPVPCGSGGRPVLASGSGWGSRERRRAGEPAGPSRPGKPVETCVAMELTCAGGSAGGVETGLLALPCEEMEGGLFLYNRRVGSDQYLLGCLSWSASVSQTTARTETDCRRLPRAA